MDRLVEAEVRCAVAPGVVGEHLVVERPDLVQRLVPDVRAGELAGEPLERAHDAKEVGQVLRAHLRDARAAVREKDEHALVRQHLERLPHRRPRDAEELAELELRDLAAGLELTLGHHVPDPGQRLVVERRLGDFHAFAPCRPSPLRWHPSQLRILAF